MNDDHRATLVDRSVELLSKYLETRSTSTVRELAAVIVELRGTFIRPKDGLPDWRGRGDSYRNLMTDLYTRSGTPREWRERKNIQADVSYHVGNRLREVVPLHELESCELLPKSPRERTRLARSAIMAHRDTVSRPQDTAQLTSYAYALLDYADETAISGQDRGQIATSHAALRLIRDRADKLIGRIEDAA
jgi:hypothetical protein